MNLTLIFLINAVAILAVAFVVWLISIPLKDVGIVDIFWGFGFAMVAWVTVGLTGNFSLHAIALATMVTLWGTRLGLYLAKRNLGGPEDSRYQSMRDKIGRDRFWWVSLFVVFWLQGVIMWVVSLPIQMGITASPTFQWLCLIGFAIWLTGLLFESIGDFQLARFKSNPENKGEVLDEGLWKYTRHPNYFGDFLVWWGLYAWVAFTGAALLSVIGPIVMSILLLKVSGVSLLEKTIEERRPGYRDYIRRTSPFFPWPPKEESTKAQQTSHA